MKNQTLKRRLQKHTVKDRLETHLIEWMLNRWGVQIESIESVPLTPTFEEQLLKDLLALMTLFTGRFHRMRRGRKIKPEER